MYTTLATSAKHCETTSASRVTLAPPLSGTGGEMQDFHTVTPDRWLPRGETMVDGEYPLVVWSGIPGETGRVRIEHRGQNQTYSVWLDADPRHPDRVDPPCDRYRLCGGCPLMHLNDNGQERARRQMVGSALHDAGLFDVNFGLWHESPDGLEDFRHVVKLGFGRSDQGRIRVGAWGRLNRQIVPIPKCNVAHPALNRTMNALAHHVIELDIWPWEPETKRGCLRAAILRVSRFTGEIHVTLVAGKHNKLLGELAERVTMGVSDVVGMAVHYNEEPGNNIFARDEEGHIGVRHLEGKGTIVEKLGEVEYDIGPGDFFQTNPAMAEIVYERVLAGMQLEKGVPVVDLYSGVGGIALQAAKVTGWALGVEVVEGAVHRAREAARRQHIPAEFMCGEVDWVLPEVAKRVADARPVVCVNPARRGLEDGVIEHILALRPRRIAYVSCNPRALARDLVAFKDAGFIIKPLELFDMFPNTAHVETLVILEAADAGADAVGRAPRRRRVSR